MFFRVYWHTLSRAQKVGKKWTYIYRVSELSALFYIPVVGECISKALKGLHYFRTTTKVNSQPKTFSSTVNRGWQMLTDMSEKTKAFKYYVLRFVSRTVNLKGEALLSADEFFKRNYCCSSVEFYSYIMAESRPLNFAGDFKQCLIDFRNKTVSLVAFTCCR